MDNVPMVLHMQSRTNNLKRQLKSFVGQMIFSSGVYRPLLADAAVIVAFHRVSSTTVGDPLTCNVEMFTRYCQFFARYFHVVSLGHLVEKMEKGVQLNRELAITFDDGYQDNYEYAAPILKAMGLPATFFIVTQFIGTEFVPWWDRNIHVSRAWMTWDQAQRLYHDGFEIGAHTRTHANLGGVSGDKAWQEIHGSRLDLEEKLSIPVPLFAYPYGGEEHMAKENRAFVKAARFRCCCSCFGGINNSGTDPFLLRRIPISPWYLSPYHFGCEVALRRT